MSRSGYTDDCDLDGPKLELWRGAVLRAVNGKRGQAFLRELLVALDALPEKWLISDELVDKKGNVCTLGAICVKRGVNTAGLDPDDEYAYREKLAKLLRIAPALVAEIAYMNDDGLDYIDFPKAEDGARKFQRMRNWVAEQIRPEPNP